jgi:hypothetical protein
MSLYIRCKKCYLWQVYLSGKRPYASQEDMQNKLGAKRSLNWLKAYKASDKLKATK